MSKKQKFSIDMFVAHVKRLENLKLTKKVRTALNFKRVKRRAKKGFFKSLGQAAGAIRLTARRSIREGKPKKEKVPLQFYTPYGRNLGSLGYEMTVARRNPGPAGKPPRTWLPKRYLKESILYEVDEQKQVARVYINPKFDSYDLWRRHEIGGTFTNYYRHTYFVVGKPFQNSKTRSQEFRQQSRVWSVRSAWKSGKVHYEKRPFLAPAMEKLKPRLPGMWKNAIHV